MVLLQAWVVMATMSSTMEVLVAVAEFIYRLAMVVAASKVGRSRSKLLRGLWPCATEVTFTDNVSVQLNLGPISPTMAGANKSASALVWNPRCAKRDLTNFASKTWFTFENLYNITLGAASKDIPSFQNELQGRFTDGFLGQ